MHTDDNNQKNHSLDYVDQLLIRACKSHDPLTRIKSIYRRFFLSGSFYVKPMLSRLVKICDDNSLAGSEYIITALHPSNHILYTPDDDAQTDSDRHWMLCLNILIQKIRLTKSSDIKGFVQRGHAGSAN